MHRVALIVEDHESFTGRLFSSGIGRCSVHDQVVLSSADIDLELSVRNLLLDLAILRIEVL
jgi:hypothetical protein